MLSYGQKNGTNPTLVLVHGYLGGARMWQGQIDHFKSGFNVVVPELAGYGDSFELKSHSSIEDMATAVLDALSNEGVDEFHLLGHSMGGMIVQQMTAQAPTRIKKLICFGTGPQGVLPNRFEPISKSRERLGLEGVQSTAAKIATNWYLKGGEDKTYPLCLKLSKNVSLETAQNGLTAMETWDGRDNLSLIACPTLVLWGDNDKSYGWSQPAALWNEIPNSSLSVMANCGHNAHLEKPEIFNAIVNDFLIGSE